MLGIKQIIEVNPYSIVCLWDNLLIMTDTQGNKMPAPLDFCPDFLYKISKPKKKK